MLYGNADGVAGARKTTMQLTLPHEPLLEACKVAEKAIASRPLDPLLDNLHVQAREADCLLTATDGIVGLRVRVPAQVGLSGRTLIPARQFFGIIRAAAGEELALCTEENRVWVRAAGAEFELRADDPARFPSFPPCPDGRPDEIPPETLHVAIQRTVFAAGAEASSHSRAGVLWEFEKDRVRLVATDNRRLAVTEVPVPGRGRRGRRREALVPVHAMDLLGRVASAAEGPVRVLFGERHLFVRSPGAALCARLMEGRFPDWRRVLPAEPRARYRVLLPVEEFLAGVKQAAVLRDRPEARVVVRFERGRVTLRSRQEGTGRAWVRRALVEPAVREPVEVAFNTLYLTELLRVLGDEETVRLELRGAEAPALFCAGDAYKHFLMPLRRG
jgi:DNA polymerase-3 subunit beta